MRSITGMTILALIAGSLTVAAQEGPPFKASPGKKLALEFPKPDDGGALAGAFNNIGFSINTGQATRTITLKPGDPQKEVSATYDYADCSTKSTNTLETPVRALARGQPAWVDYVEVSLFPAEQGTPPWSGGLCYGYRKAGAGWQWRLDSQPLKQAGGRVTGRVFIKEPNVDAVKLVFDQSVPNLGIRNITVTVQPIQSAVVK